MPAYAETFYTSCKGRFRERLGGVSTFLLERFDANQWHLPPTDSRYTPVNLGVGLVFLVMDKLRAGLRSGFCPPKPLPPLSEFMEGKHPADCYIHAEALRSVLFYGGFKTKLLKFSSYGGKPEGSGHISSLVYLDDTWTLVDAYYRFVGVGVDGRVIPWEQLVKSPDLLLMWENHFSSEATTTSMRLSSYLPYTWECWDVAPVFI